MDKVSVKLNIEPNAKQSLFFNSDAMFVLYGGARGGGKSWALRIQAVRLCLMHANLKVVLFRLTYPDLESNHITPIRTMLAGLINNGLCKFNSAKKTFSFANGSVLSLRSVNNENRLLNYQGQEYEVICVDEATQFQEQWLVTLTATLRTTNPEFKPRMYLTANPGGIGHAYVKRVFVDGQRTAEEEARGTYQFIAATVYDNQARVGESYVNMLKALPEYQRMAWLNGDWDAMEGQAFSEFRKRDYDAETLALVSNGSNNAIEFAQVSNPKWHNHVIKSFAVPTNWDIVMGYDHGYNKPFACSWYAVDEDGTLYNIAEYYGCTGNADEGVKFTPEQIIQAIKDKERTHPNLQNRKSIRRIADPAIFQHTTGESVAELFAKSGLYFEKGDNQRLNGWAQVHNRLQFDSNGFARLYFFDECKHMLRTLSLLMFDSKHNDDIDSRGEDHLADELRYVCMAYIGKSAAQTVAYKGIKWPEELK